MRINRNKVLSFKTDEERVRYLSDEFTNKELAMKLVELFKADTNSNDDFKITLSEFDLKKLQSLFNQTFKQKQTRIRVKSK